MKKIKIKIIGLLFLVFAIYLLIKPRIHNRTQPTNAEEFILAFEDELKRGIYCFNDKQCQISAVFGGGEIGAICYQNHCLYCSPPSNVMCAAGYHGCEDIAIKEAVLEKYPDFPLECFDIPPSYCID